MPGPNTGLCASQPNSSTKECEKYRHSENTCRDPCQVQDDYATTVLHSPQRENMLNCLAEYAKQDKNMSHFIRRKKTLKNLKSTQ